MPIEVEQKFPLGNRNTVLSRLNELGAVSQAAVTQIDTYYAHPARDFATTDEALRIRRVGEANFLTYKGPKLDTKTKTRREIELPLNEGKLTAEQWDQLLSALSFKRVAEVTKVRHLFRLTHEGQPMEVALDSVQGLGDFAEIEIVVDQRSQIEVAQQHLQALAAQLQLADAERRGYLELLLGKQATIHETN